MQRATMPAHQARIAGEDRLLLAAAFDCRPTRLAKRAFVAQAVHALASVLGWKPVDAGVETRRHRPSLSRPQSIAFAPRTGPTSTTTRTPRHGRAESSVRRFGRGERRTLRGALAMLGRRRAPAELGLGHRSPAGWGA